MLTRQQLHNQIFWYCSLAIAFFLPVSGRIIPTIIVVMILNWLINGRIIENFKRLVQERPRLQALSFASLYLLYVIGLTYTSNFDYAWFDLEVKMSILIFPLIFATSPWPVLNGKQYQKVFISFIAGCLTGALIILTHASVEQFVNDVPRAFYYTSLAWYFHSTYLAMYYNFAVGILLLGLIHDNQMPVRNKLIIIGLIVFFSWMIILLSSKAGLISLAVVLIFSAFVSILFLRNFKNGMAIVVTGGLLFFAGYFLAPVAFSRMATAEQTVAAKTQDNHAKAESNADRLLVWQTAIQIIGEHFFFGVGTGDVKDALLEGYAKRQALPAIQHKYNAHSQLLQTFVTLGLTGILLFLFLLAWPAVKSFKTHRFVYLIFLLIFALNALTESMLEIQAGVIFYAFFNSLLYSKWESG